MSFYKSLILLVFFPSREKKHINIASVINLWLSLARVSICLPFRKIEFELLSVFEENVRENFKGNRVAWRCIAKKKRRCLVVPISARSYGLRISCLAQGKWAPFERFRQLGQKIKISFAPRGRLRTYGLGERVCGRETSTQILMFSSIPPRERIVTSEVTIPLTEHQVLPRKLNVNNREKLIIRSAREIFMSFREIPLSLSLKTDLTLCFLSASRVRNYGVTVSLGRKFSVLKIDRERIVYFHISYPWSSLNREYLYVLLFFFLFFLFHSLK